MRSILRTLPIRWQITMLHATILALVLAAGGLALWDAQRQYQYDGLIAKQLTEVRALIPTELNLKLEDGIYPTQKADPAMLKERYAKIAAAILPPAAQWTMDDFFNAAQKLTAGQGDNKQYGFVMPRGTSEGVYFLVHLLGAAAAQGSGETLKPNFTDPNAVQAIRKVVDLLKNDTPHTWLDDYSRASAFISCWTRPSPSMVQWSGSP